MPDWRRARRNGGCSSGWPARGTHRQHLGALLRHCAGRNRHGAREEVDLSALVASMVELYAPVSDERALCLSSSVAAGRSVRVIAVVGAGLGQSARQRPQIHPRRRARAGALQGSPSEPEVVVQDDGPDPGGQAPLVSVGACAWMSARCTGFGFGCRCGRGHQRTARAWCSMMPGPV